MAMVDNRPGSAGKLGILFYTLLDKCVEMDIYLADLDKFSCKGGGIVKEYPPIHDDPALRFQAPVPEISYPALCVHNSTLYMFDGYNPKLMPWIPPPRPVKTKAAYKSSATLLDLVKEREIKGIKGFLVFVPNSLFSSPVIVNKSPAKWHAMVHKIPLQIDDIDKISKISEDIKSMLRSNTNVFLEKEAPYCFLSQIERSYAELTLRCNLKQVSKEAEHDFLLEAVWIIKQHSATLDSTRQDTIS